MSQDFEKLLAEALLELKRLSSEVRCLREQISGNPSFAEGWTDGASAWQPLQAEGVKSQKHLQKLRLAGAFSELKNEIRNVSGGDRPTWEYNVPKCRKALQRHFQKIAS